MNQLCNNYFLATSSSAKPYWSYLGKSFGKIFTNTYISFAFTSVFLLFLLLFVFIDPIPIGVHTFTAHPVQAHTSPPSSFRILLLCYSFRVPIICHSSCKPLFVSLFCELSLSPFPLFLSFSHSFALCLSQISLLFRSILIIFSQLNVFHHAILHTNLTHYSLMQ